MDVSGKRTLATAPGLESSRAAKSLIMAAVKGSIGIWFSPKVLKYYFRIFVKNVYQRVVLFHF
jgi:hypothetical protein